MISHNSPEQSHEFVLQDRLQKLQSIAELLKEMGFKVHSRFLRADFLKDGEPDFPIVSDGADGIRISIDPKKGLVVWFTNGFEDKNNPKRQEVEEKLRVQQLQ